MMKKLLLHFFNLIGYQISIKKKKRGISFLSDIDQKIGYEFEENSIDGIKMVRKHTMLPYVNLVTLYEQVRYCELNKIEGDFVECGVWKGGAVGLMAIANLEYGSQRRALHLFDAFEEICAPNEDFDGKKAINEVKKLVGKNSYVKGELKPLTGIYDRFGGPGNIQVCKDLIEQTLNYPKDMVHYHKGWFQNTLPAKAPDIEKIAILRLDGDWYESTKVCLENLFDKVVPGGFIIIDDYGAYSGCKKAVDEFFISKKVKSYLNYSNWCCRYIVKNEIKE